jgi:ribose 5-phosphate isomerase A
MADANLEELKKAAAQAASDLVTDGMVVGLGTGSTAKHLVDIIGARVAKGLDILAIPTSEATRVQALGLGIRIIDFSERQRLDICIDGADEIGRGTLDLIKGGGGALLREKIVAAASDRMVVISDSTKVRDRIGGGFPLPVEIVPFGWEVTLKKLQDRTPNAKVRSAKDGNGPYLTDGGHYIVDCLFETIDNAAALERDIDTIVGVVESGLFVGIAKECIIADPKGVYRLLPG